MKELNLLSGYPKPINPRIVGDNLRSINHRIVASKRDERFFDGHRNFGYGGFDYDGRWKPIASNIIKEHLYEQQSKFLQINCEKGFLLSDILSFRNDIEIVGTETSSYAINKSVKSIKNKIINAQPTNLPFEDNYFNYVLAIGTIYTLTLTDALKAIEEIVRVSKGNSFITLATYSNEEEYFLFRDWTLLGTLMFKRKDWIEILKSVNYEGDYFFTDSNSLNLIRE